MPTVRDVMTSDPYTLDETATLGVAAKAMREHNIGAVLVTDGRRQLTGIVTDRDIVVDGLAQGRGAETEIGALLEDVELETASPRDDLAEVIGGMRQRAVKRIPVVEDGEPVGIVSLGDLALERDVDSIVEELAASPPND